MSEQGQSPQICHHYFKIRSVITEIAPTNKQTNKQALLLYNITLDRRVLLFLANLHHFETKLLYGSTLLSAQNN